MFERRLILFVSAVLLLLTAACGGDDDDATGPAADAREIVDLVSIPGGQAAVVTSQGLTIVGPAGELVASARFETPPLLATAALDGALDGVVVMGERDGLLTASRVEGAELGPATAIADGIATDSVAGLSVATFDDAVTVGLLITRVSSSNFSLGTMAVSTDGGTSWSIEDAPAGGSLSSDGHRFWLVGGPTGGSMHVREADGTWRPVQPPVAETSFGPVVVDADGRAIAAGITAGDPAGLAVYESADGGATWVPVQEARAVLGSVGVGVRPMMVAADDGGWLAVDPGGSRIVGSGGSVISPNGLPGSIQRAASVGGRTLLALTASEVCDEGRTACVPVSRLSISTDAGQTWAEHALP